MGHIRVSQQPKTVLKTRKKLTSFILMARGPGTRRLGPIFVKKPTLAAKNRSKDPQKRTSIVFMRAEFSENHTYGRLRVPVFISALSFA